MGWWKRDPFKGQVTSKLGDKEVTAWITRTWCNYTQNIVSLRPLNFLGGRLNHFCEGFPDLMTSCLCCKLQGRKPNSKKLNLWNISLGNNTSTCWVEIFSQTSGPPKNQHLFFGAKRSSLHHLPQSRSCWNVWWSYHPNTPQPQGCGRHGCDPEGTMIFSYMAGYLLRGSK